MRTNYKGYIIAKNDYNFRNSFDFNFEFFNANDCDDCLKYGSSIEDCKSKIDELKQDTLSKKKALQLINDFTLWDTSQGERDGIKSALICVKEILSWNNTSFWEDVEFEIKNQINK